MAGHFGSPFLGRFSIVRPGSDGTLLPLSLGQMIGGIRRGGRVAFGPGLCR